MRGLLRFTKAAPPLRRGGLAFTAIGAPLIVSAKQLTGFGLAQLIADQTVRIEAGQDDGTFTPAPEFIDVGVDQLQMLIDAAPDVELPAELGGMLTTGGDPAAEELDRIASMLRHAGFDSLETLLTVHASVGEALAKAETDQREATGRTSQLESELQAANAKGSELTTKVAALESKLAEGNAGGAEKGGKPKAVKTTE